ncbi:MAG: 16S rRNA (guanine(966)-N(2))-methyltransferase RsmD [Candidatus Izemoplasmatales bacterium]
MISMLRIISGKYKGRKILEANPAFTRPTTDKNKEMVFNILGQYFSEGICLDLFAGSGALGIEALSRGMDSVSFVDSNNEAIRIIRHNLSELHIGIGTEAWVYHQDYLLFLAEHRLQKYNLIFLDPPYATNYISQAILTIANYQMLSANGIIVVENDKLNETVINFNDIILYREVVAGNSKFAFYRWRE